MTHDVAASLDSVQLARACARKPADQEAWKELVRRFEALVCWKATQILRAHTGTAHPETVEDIAQEVFSRLFMHISEFDPAGSSLSTFLTVITENITKDHLRRRHRDGRLLSMDESRELLRGLRDGTFDMAALTEKVYEVAHATPASRNRKLITEYLQGDDPEDLSERYQLSVSTIYRILAAYRERLRGALRGLGGES